MAKQKNENRMKAKDLLYATAPKAMPLPFGDNIIQLRKEYYQIKIKRKGNRCQ